MGSRFSYRNASAVNLKIAGFCLAEAEGGDRKTEVCKNGRLPGGDVIFESVGMLFVKELEREAFFHPGSARLSFAQSSH